MGYRLSISGMRRRLVFAMSFFIFACSEVQQETERPYVLAVPATFRKPPPTPADNALTEARIALGRLLFHETALSADGTISCASCHKAHLAYADDRPLSPGVHGKTDLRNAPSLLNVVYQKALFAEGGVPSLEAQVLAPFGNPNEMAFTLKDASAQLSQNATYANLSQKAYGKAIDGYVIARALSAFQRSLVSAGSPYDAYRLGDSLAISVSAKRGEVLFYSEALACGSCHSGILFTDQSYHNIGLYTTYADEGRARLTLDSADLGKFKTPSLRNVAITAPYMHNGSLATLDAVLVHFNNGGVGHVNQSELIKPLGLNGSELSDLKSFLESLTDTNFVSSGSYKGSDM
jgi:cytochrome c peroxidase